jgi:hypothetical protein
MNVQKLREIIVSLRELQDKIREWGDHWHPDADKDATNPRSAVYKAAAKLHAVNHKPPTKCPPGHTKDANGKCNPIRGAKRF